jgi:Cu/Ag efflux pump CusA
LATRGIIVMLRSYQRRERHGAAFGMDLIVDETSRLAVPVAVSAGAIGVMFLPLALAGSRAGLEIVGPMAVAVLGGLITTVLLTVGVIPSAYLEWGYVAEPDTEADDLFTPEPSTAANVGR